MDGGNQNIFVRRLQSLVSTLLRWTSGCKSNRRPRTTTVLPDVAAPTEDASAFYDHQTEGPTDEVYFTDVVLLNCTICGHQLCAPIYQCENGHGASCGNCCIKSGRQCGICLFPLLRAGALLEEMHMSFKNKRVKTITVPIAKVDPDRELPHHCEICSTPLWNRIYHQCDQKGHITCSCCSKRLKRKCRLCTWGYNNRAKPMGTLVKKTKIIECRYKRFGCNKALTYGKKKADHETRCAHMLCFCPTCPFASSFIRLYDHVKGCHSVTQFAYGDTFYVAVDVGQKHVILQDEDDGIIFILSHRVVQETRRDFIVDCIGPPILNSAFIYELTVRYKNMCSSMKSTPVVYTKWEEHTPNGGCPIIPSSIGQPVVQVCIRKVYVERPFGLHNVIHA